MSLYNTNAILMLLSYYNLNYLLLFFFSIHSFIFSMLFIKDNFVKQLIISLFHTILIVFLNMCEMPKMSYNLRRMEYLIQWSKDINLEKCYLNNHLFDNFWYKHNLQRKSRYLHKNQNNREIK